MRIDFWTLLYRNKSYKSNLQVTLTGQGCKQRCCLANLLHVPNLTNLILYLIQFYIIVNAKYKDWGDKNSKHFVRVHVYSQDVCRSVNCGQLTSKFRQSRPLLIKMRFVGLLILILVLVHQNSKQCCAEKSGCLGFSPSGSCSSIYSIIKCEVREEKRRCYFPISAFTSDWK